MILPKLNYSEQIRKETQIRFAGLDHNIGARDGSIWDMSNLTGARFPVLTTRPHRHLYKKLQEPGGIYCWAKLCWVEQGKFFYDGVEKGIVTPGLKTFGSLGSFIVILPDKAYYDVKSDTFGRIESTLDAKELIFTNGTIYEELAKANTIQAPGVDWKQYFKPDDPVTISGCTKHPENNKSIVIREIDGDKMIFSEYSFTLEPEDKPYTETGDLQIKRKMPDLIDICENKGRLWGCTKDTIHASSPKNIFRWENYGEGLDTDAWALTPGTVGYFQGCTSYKGYPIFAKEDKLTKVYGTFPREFQTSETASLGVQEGSGKSIATAGENLFYLGRNGMTAFSGGIPTSIAQPFGTEKYREGVAGSDGLHYYISMRGQDGRFRLLTLDPQYGVWTKEDYLHVTHFAYCDGNLYALSEDGCIWILGAGTDIPEGTELEPDFSWFVETGDFTEGSANRKDLGKLQIRGNLESGAYMKVLVQYDSDGEWHVVRCLEGTGRKINYNLPITPHRCDHYRLRLEGRGDCEIYSIKREFTHGTSVG